MTAKKKTIEPSKPEPAKPVAKKAAAKAAPKAVKPAAAKPAAPKAAAPKKSASKSVSAAQPVATLSPEQRYQRIQTEAYFIAERAGFKGDSSLHWIAAEKKVNAELA